MGKGRNRKRGAAAASTTYSNIEFRPRPSSGRPGSPHRFFESSFDVVAAFDDAEKKTTDTDDDGDTTETKKDDNDNDNVANHSRCHQVVHRHANGLCIITAGNILQASKKEATAITSVDFAVRVGSDSKSARGKHRAKKHKSSTSGEANESDGIVSPTDPLCHVTYNDGTKVALHCCVGGTVIELNRRLDGQRGKAEEGGGQIEEGKKEAAMASLLLSDPLLDGHLAVIMPNKDVKFPR